MCRNIPYGNFKVKSIAYNTVLQKMLFFFFHFNQNRVNKSHKGWILFTVSDPRFIHKIFNLKVVTSFIRGLRAYDNRGWSKFEMHMDRKYCAYLVIYVEITEIDLNAIHKLRVNRVFISYQQFLYVQSKSTVFTF